MGNEEADVQLICGNTKGRCALCLTRKQEVKIVIPGGHKRGLCKPCVASLVESGDLPKRPEPPKKTTTTVSLWKIKILSEPKESVDDLVDLLDKMRQDKKIVDWATESSGDPFELDLDAYEDGDIL